jgi:DnaJ-class molecular chaperone
LRANVLGCFIKSLSLRIDVNPEQSVAELIGQTRTVLFGTMRTLIYPWLHQMRDLQVPPEEQVGTEMNVSGAGIYEYANIHGIDYPSVHIEMPESEEHIFMVVQIREEGLTFNVEGSEALYTQEQLDTMARLSAEYTLQLIGDQSKKLKDIHIM